MSRFNKILSFDPKNIKDMSIAQKRECMDEIDGRKSFSMKFSGFFSLGVAAYFFLRAMINFWSFLRDLILHEFPSPIILISAAVIMVISVFACMIKKSMMTLNILAFAAFGVFAIMSREYFIVPFAFFGCVVYYRLMEVCEVYDVLSKETGFPDFYELSADMVKNPQKSIGLDNE